MTNANKKTKKKIGYPVQIEIFIVITAIGRSSAREWRSCPKYV